MDVLDHSCSKLGFGGKMCLDGTRKFEEEIDENFQWSIGDGHPGSYRQAIDEAKLKFPEIKEINKSLLAKEIPCLIISVEKNRKGHIKELHQKI
jgi:4-hydroxy-3-polyprenylbenzoate decarboxylase